MQVGSTPCSRIPETVTVAGPSVRVGPGPGAVAVAVGPMVAGFVDAVGLAAAVALADAVALDDAVALGDVALVAGSVPVSGVSAQPVRSSGPTSSALTTAI